MKIDNLLLKTLDDWDFPDTKYEPDGWDMKSVPTASDANFQKLIEEHNKMVEAVNTILKVCIQN